jgi:glycosyltransferase involved in cell wall biosynthesis
VVVFAQNHLLFSQAPLDQYSWPIRARLHVERLWMKLFGAGVARFIVQSRTMATLVCRQFPSQNPILILPLYGDIGVPCSRAQSREKQFDFIYVADGEPHKNHRNLIEAWCLLASEEIRPSLALTIDPSRYAPLCAFIQERCTAHDLNITNLGVVTPQEILARYLASSALVFPSNFESFGLPLIEASQVGLPIIAGERDFVRDVCSPVHTFDPESPVSICRAIRRFLDVPEKPAGLCSAEGFIAKVRGI